MLKVLYCYISWTAEVCRKRHVGCWNYQQQGQIFPSGCWRWRLHRPAGETLFSQINWDIFWFNLRLRKRSCSHHGSKPVKVINSFRKLIKAPPDSSSWRVHRRSPTRPSLWRCSCSWLAPCWSPSGHFSCRGSSRSRWVWTRKRDGATDGSSVLREQKAFKLQTQCFAENVFVTTSLFLTEL